MLMKLPLPKWLDDLFGDTAENREKLQQFIKKPEMITGVALMTNKGEVIALPAPHRHGRLFAVMAVLDISYESEESGFMTSYGRYINRRDAYRLAKANGQYNRRPYDSCTLEELFSEDLW